jgi:hypothetical protein
MQDSSEANMQGLAWMFYYYGTEVHRLGQSTLSHREWVEQKVMTLTKVSYVHLRELLWEYPLLGAIKEISY